MIDELGDDEFSRDDAEEFAKQLKKVLKPNFFFWYIIKYRGLLFT